VLGNGDGKNGQDGILLLSEFSLSSTSEWNADMLPDERDELLLLLLPPLVVE